MYGFLPVERTGNFYLLQYRHVQIMKSSFSFNLRYKKTKARYRPLFFLFELDHKITTPLLPSPIFLLMPFFHRYFFCPVLKSL